MYSSCIFYTIIKYNLYCYNHKYICATFLKKYFIQYNNDDYDKSDHDNNDDHRMRIVSSTKQYTGLYIVKKV